MDIEVFTAGLVSFTSIPTLHTTQNKAAKGSDKKLTIDWGDFQGHGWNELAPNIAKITAEVFQIFNNLYEPILKELTLVSFPNLTKLHVGNNRILSIQCLVNYDWPLLKQLDLSNNFIISAKSFAKVNLKNLQVLNLKYNPLANREDFFRANFSKLKHLYLSSSHQLLSEKKINMTFDPIIWKIKLQPILQKEANRNYYEYRAGYYGNYGDSEQLTYQKYRDQLKKKGKSSQPSQNYQQNRQYGHRYYGEQQEQQEQYYDDDEDM